MRIDGIDNRTPAELERDLAAGGRFVLFECCISLIVITLRRPSPVCFLRPGDSGAVRGLRYTVVSLLLGWWGLPWGVIYTPLALLTNLGGGRDVTARVWPLVRHQTATTS